MRDPDAVLRSIVRRARTLLGTDVSYLSMYDPAGMTADGLPVTISFFGPAWSEPKLLGYGYDFEQATHAIQMPKYTPALPSDLIRY